MDFCIVAGSTVSSCFPRSLRYLFASHPLHPCIHCLYSLPLYRFTFQLALHAIFLYTMGGISFLLVLRSWES